MELSTRILGRSTVAYLTTRTTAAVLQIGSDTFTRGQLAGVACFNFLAAATLSRILRHELPAVRDTRDLFTRVPPAALALPQLGAVALAVLGAAFELKRIGGAAPLEAWVTRHAPAGTKPLQTFHTIKAHEAAAARDERAARRSIVAGRRARAHRARLERFDTHHHESTQ